MRERLRLEHVHTDQAAPAAALLEAGYPYTAMPPELLVYTLTSPGNDGRLLVVDDEIVGVVLWRRSYGVMTVKNLTVAEAHRRRGLAAETLRRLPTLMRPAYGAALQVEVREDLLAGQLLCRSLGLRCDPTATRRGPLDVYLFTLPPGKEIACEALANTST